MKKNKVILLTGYRGLAGAILETLNQRYQFSILVRSQEALKKCQQQYPNIDFFLGDQTDPKARKEWISGVINKFGSIDGLINNAAVTGPPGKLGEVAWSEFQDTIAVNLLAPIALIKELLEQQKNTPFCAINLSGGGATIGRAKFSAYAITKTALVRMTENLAMEYPTHRFYAISPGRLFTPMIEKVLAMDPSKVEAHELADAQTRRQGDADSPQLAIGWIEWLLENRPENLNGMLLHAVWDDKERLLRYPGHLGWNKLRRIDQKTLSPLSEWVSSDMDGSEKNGPRSLNIPISER